MFTPSLDHLHLLVMLVIAFFSFRAYNNNTLAIEYEPQGEKVEQGNDEVRHEVSERPQETVENLEMNSEDVDNVQAVGNPLSDNVVEVDSNNSMNVEAANSANILSDVSLGQNKHHEITTIQGSFEKIDEESSGLNPPEALEKEQDQESTLVRGESRLGQQECDEEDVECSSSSENSLSESSSQGSEEEVKESRREKRKRIQKAKRVEKKNLRRQKHVTENQVQLIVID